MVYNSVCKLCQKHNISVTQLEKILGFGNGTIHSWRESSPSVAKAKVVADFFEVSVDDLIEEESR